MSPEEVSILDLLDRALADRDRLSDAKLETIAVLQQATASALTEVRSDLRSLHAQLTGVATGAEIASLKRHVNTEIDALDLQMRTGDGELDARLKVVERQLGDSAAVEKWKRRALAGLVTTAGLLLTLAGVLVAAL